MANRHLRPVSGKEKADELPWVSGMRFSLVVELYLANTVDMHFLNLQFEGFFVNFILRS